MSRSPAPRTAGSSGELSATHRKGARHLAGIVDRTFQFIGVLAPDGTLLDANASALAFAQATLDDVVDLPFWDTPWWSASPDREWLRRAVADAAAGSPVRREAEHTAPGGRRIVVDFSLTPLFDEQGRVDALLAEGRDLTERKRTEEALRAAEQRAAFLADAGTVLSSSLDFGVTCDRLAELIVPAAATFCIIDVLDGRDAIRRLRVEHQHPEMRDVAARLATYPRRDQRRYLTSEAITTGEARIVRAVADAFLAGLAEDAEHLAVLRALAPASYMVAPLVARGRVLGAIAFCRDGSAPPYDEPDLAMATDIAQRAGLALDNAQLYEQSVRAARARDDMLALVSHDLRNPLSAISMCTAALLEQGEPDPSRANLLRTARDSADWAHRLIQDLLDVAAIEAGRLSLERDAVDPLVVAVQTVELFEPLAAAEGVALRLDVPEHLPRVCADAERLVQALGNLVGNAVKFTPRGGQVGIQASSDGAHVTIAVIDAGPGVPVEHLPFIFDRYWHARRGTRARGIGLGLAIVKAIVEAHDGRVRVEAGERGGSCFSMSLPVMGCEGDTA